MAISQNTATALALGEEAAAATIDLIEAFCNDAPDWIARAGVANDKILAFRRASVEVERES